MLTFVATPKACNGIFEILQKNAVLSWRNVLPEAEILLLGEEVGVAALAKSIGARNIKEIQRNSFGTPLVSSIIEAACREATYPNICYINADIILEGSLAGIMQNSWAKFSLLVGKRSDVIVEKLLEFSKDLSLKESLKVAHEITNGFAAAIDYFIFPKSLYKKIPAFALGRSLWDNWLVAKARELNYPVIDISDGLHAYHQMHDYASSMRTRDGWWYGPEWECNYILSGGRFNYYTLEDATYLYSSEKNILLPNGLSGAHRRTTDKAIADLNRFHSIKNHHQARANLLKRIRGEQ